ncbi:MAG: chalcone isomerase family protein [Pseudomonadota bacterium]
MLTVAEGDTAHSLALTGVDRRVVFIFRVYRIAHYAEPASLPALPAEGVFTDGPAKAISILFERNLGVERIRKELEASIRRNARAEWLEAAHGTISSFMTAIDRDAVKGDRLVLYWLDGGRVFAEFNGEREFEATDPAFAKAIWSIWFGKDPVCDRDLLLARLVTEDQQ